MKEIKKIKTEAQEGMEPEVDEKKGMKLGWKIGIGAAAATAVGGLLYLLLRDDESSSAADEDDGDYAWTSDDTEASE